MISIQSEYIRKNMSILDWEKELISLIKKYNLYTNRFLFVYVSSLNKPIPDTMLNMEDYYLIHGILKNVSSDKLDFYIESGGGSGEAAEEIAKCLHSKFSNVNFIVSGEAKSAGTILVLSGDEISMTETGSLGPVDAQVPIGRFRVSAHDYLRWIDEKRLEARNNNALNPLDATMIAQISPGELQGVHEALNFAKDLIIEWLPKYKFKNWTHSSKTNEEITDDYKKKRAEELANELVNHSKWHSHGRSLKIEELRPYLKINEIDKDPKLADIIYRIQTASKFILQNSSVYKLLATENERIFRNAVPQNALPKLPEQIKAPLNVAMIIEVPCPSCGTKHKLYGTFVKNPINENKVKKFSNIKKMDSLNCSCGYQIDLVSVKNDIENRTNKKLV